MDKIEEFLKKVQEAIQGFLAPILKKLPFGHQNEDGEEEDDTLITDVKINADNNEKLDVEDDEDEDDEEEGDRSELIGKIKKNAPTIILVSVLAFLVVDQFLLTDSEVNPVAQKKPVRKKKIKKVRKKPKKEVVKEEPTNEVAVKKIEDPKPVKNDLAKEEKPKANNTVKEEVQEVEDIPPETPAVVLTKKESRESEENSEKENSSSQSEEPVKEAPMEKEEMKDNNVMGKLEKKVSTIIETIEEDKLTDPEYVSPPNYQRFGRGLVYNCKDKHWACVNQYSYLKCHENYKWNKGKGKDIECYTKNVFAEEDGCIQVQQYYTNNNENTDFCKSE